MIFDNHVRAWMRWRGLILLPDDSVFFVGIVA